jgi:AraC-like DNA-binding protein
MIGYGTAERNRAAAQGAASVPFRSRFDSWDRMSGAIEDFRLSTYIVSRESRPWQLTSYRLGDCLLQHGVDGASHVSTGRLAPDRVGFLLAGSDSSGRFCHGRELDGASLVRWGPGAEIALQARRPGEWLALSFAPETEARVAPALKAGESGTPRAAAGLVKAPSRELAALRDLLGETTAAFERAGPAGLPAEVARQLGEKLVRGVVRLFCEDSRPPRCGRAPRLDRGRVVSRVEETFAASSSQPFYVSSLCEALGIPERTLRHVFGEQYGAGPTQVLRSRRLCQARLALRDAPAGARVSEVAGRFGFWHLGQFAGDYRELFGELPSETLRRASSRSGDLQDPSRRRLPEKTVAEEILSC